MLITSHYSTAVVVLIVLIEASSLYLRIYGICCEVNLEQVTKTKQSTNIKQLKQ